MMGWNWLGGLSAGFKSSSPATVQRQITSFGSLKCLGFVAMGDQLTDGSSNAFFLMSDLDV